MSGGITPAAAGLHPVLAILFAGAVVAGAVVAVSSRDGRAAVLGLLVALLTAPFLADPLPDLRGVAARIVGAVLVAYPLRIAVRADPAAIRGSVGSWATDGLLALAASIAGAAAAAGWDLAARLGSSQLGGLEITAAAAVLRDPWLWGIAAGVALLVLAAAPVAFGRDPLRLTIGVTVGFTGLLLVEAGFDGPPSAFANLCVALLLAAIAAGGWALTLASVGAARPVGRAEDPAGRGAERGAEMAGSNPSSERPSPLGTAAAGSVLSGRRADRSR